MKTGNLYLRRTLLRSQVFARIPRRHRLWCPGSNAIGQGAAKWLSSAPSLAPNHPPGRGDQESSQNKWGALEAAVNEQAQRAPTIQASQTSARQDEPKPIPKRGPHPLIPLPHGVVAMLKEREKTIKRLITDISGDRRPSEARRGSTPASSSPHPEGPSPLRKAPASDRFAAVLNVQPEDTASSQSSQPTSYPSPTSTTENITTSTIGNEPASIAQNTNTPFESDHKWAGDAKTLDERLDLESAGESVDHHEVLPHQTKIQTRLKLWDADSRRAEEDEPARRPARFRGSDQIHIVGGGLGGLHIAHHLAGCHTLPPAHYLFHSLSLMKKFIKAGRQLTLHTSGGTAVHDRIIPEAQSRDKPNNEIIANLIVACLAHNVNYAVGTIKHRLNSSSTICLIQDGLGVAESLIETHFPDEASRPAILLGHWTTQIETADEPFAAVEKKPGRLYLTIYTCHNQNRAVSLIKRHPPVERVVKSTHLLRLLAQIPGLNATGHPPAQFLRAKLPAVTFRAIVEPLSALFDCHYDKLLTQDAKHLVDQLLSEVFLVISRLPETRGIVGFEDSMAVASWLRPKIYEKLYPGRHHFNDRERMKFRGGQIELDYLTGYFVRRGRELNVDVRGLDTVLQMVRIKKYFDWLKGDYAIPMTGWDPDGLTRRIKPGSEPRKHILDFPLFRDGRPDEEGAERRGWSEHGIGNKD